jgi:MFS family permease
MDDVPYGNAGTSYVLHSFPPAYLRSETGAAAYSFPARLLLFFFQKTTRWKGLSPRSFSVSISSALHVVRPWPIDEERLLTSSFSCLTVGAFCGTIPSSYLADHYGRRLAILVGSLIFILVKIRFPLAFYVSNDL